MLFTQSERDDNESRQYPGRQRSLGADNMRDLAYLKLLSREYPNIRAAASDIINLQAICGLPKGTEYFFSDLHGEHEAFIYLLRSSSGIIREKIRETFGHIISEEDEVRLANLIYYPEKMINQIKQANEYTEDWQKTAVYRLVQICREVSSKYTRSKVRKKMPKEFSGVIDELLYVHKYLQTYSFLFLFLLPCNFPDFYLKIFYFKILIYKMYFRSASVNSPILCSASSFKVIFFMLSI